MTEVKTYKLKFKPTGIIFTIPEEEAKEIYKNDRGNYEILDDNFVDDIEEPQKTTVSQQVVVDEDKKAPTKEELEALTVAKLKAFCNENKIEFAKNDAKAVLIEKILKALEKTEETIDEVCKPCYADGKVPDEKECENCDKKAAQEDVAAQVVEG